MATNPYEAYLETEIYSAAPIELVRIAYKAALESVGGARRCLAQGDIEGRSKAISRTSAILAELMLSVNRKTGTIGETLVELYDYMLRRLIVAHVEQADEPLAEVGRLLATLLEGWMRCRPAEEAQEVGISEPSLEPAAA